ncbi:hypothetical protein VTH06DRAFT_8623 [Thermothelomyces fergusii]
MLIGI